MFLKLEVDGELGVHALPVRTHGIIIGELHDEIGLDGEHRVDVIAGTEPDQDGLVARTVFLGDLARSEERRVGKEV